MNIVFKLLSKKNKTDLVWLIFLTCVTGVAELISIGAIIPLIYILIGDVSVKNSIFLLKQINEIAGYVGVDYRYFSITLFSIAVIFSNILRRLLVYISVKSVFGIGSEIGKICFSNIIFSDYESFRNINIAHTTEVISNKVNVVTYNYIMQFVGLITNLILFAFLVSALFFFVSSSLIFFVFIFLAVFYLIALKRTKKDIASANYYVATLTSEIAKHVDSTCQSISEIKTGLHEIYFFNKFISLDADLKKYQGSKQILVQLPKLTIELFAVLGLVCYLTVEIIFEQELLNIVPTIAVIVFSLQKIMPLAQSSYNSWLTIKANTESLNQVLEYARKNNDPEKISRINYSSRLPAIKGRLIVNNLSYLHYQHGPKIFDGFNIDFELNGIIGIRAHSGAGKTTLLELIIGLLNKKSGTISIDGWEQKIFNIQEWRILFSYIPQNFTIIEGTLFENVAFGVDEQKFDSELLMRSFEITALGDFIEIKDYGKDSKISNFGNNISGGQRQRIAIARAIYLNRPIVILDESFSAIDVAVVELIFSNFRKMLPDTVFIITSHSDFILNLCDKVVEIYRDNNDGMLN